MRKTMAVARKEFRQIWRDTRTLMTLLFVGGVINLFWIAAISGFVLIEKSCRPVA